MRKKTLIISLIITVALSLAAAAGCGGINTTTSKTTPATKSPASTPRDTSPVTTNHVSNAEVLSQDAAQKALNLVMADRLAEAREYFMDPEALTIVVETLGEGHDAILGNVELADSHDGFIDVFLDGNMMTPVMKFL